MHLEIYSDLVEQYPEDLDSRWDSLVRNLPQPAAELTALHATWNAAQRSEIVPIRGFNFWFPRRIAGFQILGPLSQTAEETVCLARHLETGQLMGIKLLAPGSGGKPAQLRYAMAEETDFGQEQGVAYCAFRFGKDPVLASTRELIEAAGEAGRASRSAAAPAPVAPSMQRNHANAAPMRERLTRFMDRMRAVWKRPTFSKTTFSVIAMTLGALAFAGSALPQRGDRSPSRIAAGENADAGRTNPKEPGFEEMSLDRLDLALARNSEDAQASAYRAILLAQQKSRFAWSDYECVARVAPRSFAAKFLDDYLESQLGPKPRTIPSVSGETPTQPSTSLDFALLGLASSRSTGTAPASAAFSK